MSMAGAAAWAASGTNSVLTAKSASEVCPTSRKFTTVSPFARDGPWNGALIVCRFLGQPARLGSGDRDDGVVDHRRALHVVRRMGGVREEIGGSPGRQRVVSRDVAGRSQPLPQEAKVVVANMVAPNDAGCGPGAVLG